MPYHHGDLRSALLSRARADVDLGGDAAVSLRGLAAAAGVSPNAPYRHFPTKEALLAALSAQGFAELTARFAPYWNHPDPERLTGYLTAYIGFARDNPGLYRLMFGRSLAPLSCDPELGEQARACFAALMSLVEAMYDLDPGDARIANFATQVWSLCHGAALLDIDQAAGFLSVGQRPSPRDLAETLLHGLRP